MSDDMYAEVKELLERAAVGHDKLAEDHPSGPDRHKADALRRFSQVFLRPQAAAPKPAVTLGQWLSAGSNRKVRMHQECDEICVQLIGESLTWRGRNKDEHEAIQRALLAREKVHGSAL